MNTDAKVKLVVYKEHTLGFIIPELPKDVQILHSSILKGATPNYNRTASFPFGNDENIRLASEKDFDEFNVSFVGFDNTEEYEFEGSPKNEMIFPETIKEVFNKINKSLIFNLL